MARKTNEQPPGGDQRRRRIRLCRITSIHPRLEALASIDYALPAWAFQPDTVRRALEGKLLTVSENEAGSYCCIGDVRLFTVAKAVLEKDAVIPVLVCSNGMTAIESHHTHAVMSVMLYAPGSKAFAAMGRLYDVLSAEQREQVFNELQIAEKLQKTTVTQPAHQTRRVNTNTRGDEKKNGEQLDVERTNDLSKRGFVRLLDSSFHTVFPKTRTGSGNAQARGKTRLAEGMDFTNLSSGKRETSNAKGGTEHE